MVAWLIIDVIVELSKCPIHSLLELNDASLSQYNHGLESFHATPRVFQEWRIGEYGHSHWLPWIQQIHHLQESHTGSSFGSLLL